MLTSEDVKKQAIALGADAVGIASIDRYEGVPIQMDPRQIMPEAKSVVVMAFRVMRGSLRGIEEGTFFHNYSAMGYGGLTYLYIPLVVINLSKMIEDAGYETFPMGHQSDWKAIDSEGFTRADYSRPVAPGKAAPDIMLDLRMAGFMAGLGEIGYSKVFLTPQFGPRQRLGLVITEAELEPDPIYNGPELCNRCMACVKHCPGQATSQTKTVRINLAGHDVEWGELDCSACDIAFRGGEIADDDDPVADYTEPMYGHKIKPSSITPFRHKPKSVYNTGQAICGGAGCMRACLVNLEKRGVLSNKFKKPFRTSKPWKVDWTTESPQIGPEGNKISHVEAD